MGFFKTLRGAWDPVAAVESTIEAQTLSFRRLRSQYPERDPYSWLALTLRSRPGWTGLPEFACYTQTSLFSLAPGDLAPTALGCFIVYKEKPQLGKLCASKFESIMAPVHELIETGRFVERWRAVNPWTAAHFPEIEAGLIMAAASR